MADQDDSYIIQAKFQAPSTEVEAGIGGRVLIKATAFTASAEWITYNEELNEYIEAIKNDIDESVTNLVADIETNIVGRLGYRFSVNTQAGTQYTLVQEDEGTLIRMTSNQPNEVVVPANAEVPFEVGTIVNVRQCGLSPTTISPASGVSINSPTEDFVTDGDEFGLGLVKVGTDEWDLVKSFVGVPITEVENYIADIEAHLESYDEAIQGIIDAAVGNLNDSMSGIRAELDSMEQSLLDKINALSDKINGVENDTGDLDNRLDDYLTVADFGNRTQENGYQKLPGGLIMQWGKVLTPYRRNKKAPITMVWFPIAFSNKVANIQLTMHAPYEYIHRGIYESDVGVDYIGLDAFTIEHYATGDYDDAGIDADIYWFAIGY